MRKVKVVLCKERDVSLTAYLVSTKKTPAVLILPGGAYKNCELSEGEPVAKKFNSLGFNAFVLCYSVGKHYKWPCPLEDFDSAVSYIKAHSDALCADDRYIVAAGFSAGGHLAAMAASAAENKPFAAIICYGATAAETIRYSAPEAPDANEAVCADTRPCFIASSRNDWIVPSFNTHRFVAALEANHVDYELHVYGYSMHGFSIGMDAGAAPPLFCPHVGDWVAEAVSWLNDLISGKYISIRDSAEYQDTHSKVLSTKNSCGLIFGSKQAKSALLRGFLPQYLVYEAAKKNIGSFVDGVTLRQLLGFMRVSEETLSKMDRALAAFPIEE